MQITLPDEPLRALELSDEQIALHLAIRLFADGTATLGQAAAVTGLPQAAFQSELGQRRVPIHYDLQDLQADLDTLALLPSSPVKPLGKR